MTANAVADLARATAWFRALETRRADALFQDAHAAALAGAHGEALAAELPGAGLMARSIAVRTAVFDRLILECVTEQGIDCVLNLGAGLDCRPWRLTLPATLRWIDADQEAVLEHKRSVLADLAPRCEYRAMPGDLARPEQRRRVIEAAAGKHVLAVSEGLLVYLPAEEVSDLARQLAAPAGGCRLWLTDLVGPRALAMLQSLWSPLGPGIRFQFAPEGSSAFFTPYGWSEARFCGALSEGRRLGRVRLPFATRLALWLGSSSRREEFERLAGTALLKRTAAR